MFPILFDLKFLGLLVVPYFMVAFPLAVVLFLFHLIKAPFPILYLLFDAGVVLRPVLLQSILGPFHVSLVLQSFRLGLFVAAVDLFQHFLQVPFLGLSLLL